MFETQTCFGSLPNNSSNIGKKYLTRNKKAKRSIFVELSKRIKRLEKLCDRSEGVFHRLRIDERGGSLSGYLSFMDEVYGALERERKKAKRPEPPIAGT